MSADDSSPCSSCKRVITGQPGDPKVIAAGQQSTRIFCLQCARKEWVGIFAVNTKRFELDY